MTTTQTPAAITADAIRTAAQTGTLTDHRTAVKTYGDMLALSPLDARTFQARVADLIGCNVAAIGEYAPQHTTNATLGN